MRALNHHNSLRRSSQLDSGHSLAPEDVEEKLARRTAESRSGFVVPNRDPLVGSRPVDLQPDLAQPATQVATTSADVSPQGSLQCGREGVAGT